MELSVLVVEPGKTPYRTSFDSLPEPFMEKYGNEFLYPEMAGIQNGRIYSYKVSQEAYQVLNSLFLDFDI